jgi:prolyl-tRNA editing enzyme YbaK/EbsC (Cys-tRNA(Pro) deacylase)
MTATILPERDFAFVQRLEDYLSRSGIDFELLTPGSPMPTVPMAAAAIGVDEAQIVKSLLFEARDGDVVLVVASGALPVDAAKIAEVSGLVQPRLAKPAKVIEVTGYPAGGVPPVGFSTKIMTLIDRQVLRHDQVYGGGGSEHVLLRIRTVDLLRLTDGIVVSVASTVLD